MSEGAEFLLYLKEQNNKVGFVQSDEWDRILIKRYQWLLKRLNVYDFYLCGNTEGLLKDIMVKPEKLVIRNGSSLIIYGIGKRFEEFFRHYPLDEFRNRYCLIGYTDSKRVLTNDTAIDYIPSDQLVDRQFDYVLISSSKYYREIKKNLLEEGISEQKIGLLVQCYL
jgi:hypothetical protein